MHCKRLPALTVTALASALVTVLLGACAAPPVADSGGQLTGGGAGDADQFLVVDCLLPGQVRKLGRSATYLTARRAIKTNASACEIRGGEYVSYDRADLRTALNVWLPSAQEGDAQAQNYVGEIYEKGLGVAPDYRLAAEWYRKAADQGLARAQVNLGHLYEKGLGVEQDPVTALNWYRRASGLQNDQLAFSSSIEKLQQEVTAARQEATDLRAQLAQLQNRLQGQSRNLDNSRRELDRARQQLREEQEKQRTRSPNAAVTPPGVKPSSNSDLARLQGQVNAKEQELAQLSQERGRIEQEAALLQARLTSESQDKAALQARLDETKQQLAATQAQLQGQQTQLDTELQTLRNGVAQKQAQVEEAQRALQQQQIAAAGQSNAEIRRLGDELSRKEQALQDQERLIRQLEGELSRKETTADAAAQQQLADQQALAQQIDTQVNAARAALQQYQGAIASQNNAEIAALKAELEREQQRLRDQEQRNGELERAKQELEAKLAELRGRQAAVTSEESNLQRGASVVVPTVAQPEGANAALDAAPVEFGSYYALIIGNNQYSDFPNLETAVNDANDVGQVLRTRYGFNAKVLVNANRFEVLSALNELRAKLTDKDNFLLYYAGHGTLDSANDRGHWLPTDAKPSDTTNWIPNEAVTDILNVMTAKHIMVVADSCYSGTLARAVSTSIEGGRSPELQRKWLEKMITLRSRTVITSGGLQPVLDSGGGRNSLFAKHLLDVLRSNQTILEGPLLYSAIAQRFKRDATAQKAGQNPQYSPIHFSGDTGAPFFFRPIES